MYLVIKACLPTTKETSFPLSQVHSCALEDTVVSFSCVQDKIFALRDTGDVTMTDISSSTPPPFPLPMHPLSEDNYGNEATSLLILQTTPLTLIIAHSSGMLYHCVFMEGEKVYK